MVYYNLSYRRDNMKKHFLVLLFTIFSTPLYASAWSLWQNEDEELNFRGPSQKAAAKTFTKNTDSKSAEGIFSMWKDEDEEFNFRKPGAKRYAQNLSSPYSTTPEQRQNYYDAANAYNASFAAIDYDTVQNIRDVKSTEIDNSLDKWKKGHVSIFWENYRGNNVRIEMLRNNRDLKEMRLKFVQSPNMSSDPDASISDMLNNVANRVMKRVCGRKARQSVILYERPSVELERETAGDKYKIMAKGTSIKEYGFRCIY